MTDAYTGLEQSRAGIGRPQFSPAGSAEPPSIRVDIGARDDRDACPVGPRRAGTSDPTGGLSDPTFLAATGATDAGIDVSASDRGAQIFRVRLRGEVDARTLAQLQARCYAELELGTTILVLDFAGMTASHRAPAAERRHGDLRWREPSRRPATVTRCSP